MKIILKFLFILLIMWSVYAQSQEPAPSPLGSARLVEEKSGQSKRTSEANQYVTEQRPFVVKAIAIPKGKEESDYDAYERHEKPTNERWLTYSTIWLAIVTTVLAIFTGYLWNATRKMVHSTEETAKRQLRAFIFGKGFDHGINSWDGTIREYLIYVTWENVGLTPGLDVCSWIDIKTFPANEEHHIILAPSNERRPTVMGPRATNKTAFIPIPLETMMQKWRNEIKILAWSRVEYRDIFDSEIIHHHEQCASIELIHDPSTVPPEGHPPYVIFIVHGSQNSTG